MQPQLGPDEARLLVLARQQEATIADLDVRASWPVVIEAIENRWLVAEGYLSLQELIDALQGGGGAGAQEYWIGVDDEDDRYIVAALVDSRFRSPRDAMLRELRRLESRRRGEPEAPEPPAEEPAPPLPDAAALRNIFQLLLGAQSDELPASPGGEAVRREALEELSRLVGDRDALESDEVRQAVAGLGQEDRARVAESLRVLADWAERPEQDGARVDAAIRSLEASLGWMMQGRIAEEEATRERIAESARDAIARRLRPDGDA